MKTDAGTCDNDVVDSNVTNVVGGRNVTNDDVDDVATSKVSQSLIMIGITIDNFLIIN